MAALHLDGGEGRKTMQVQEWPKEHCCSKILILCKSHMHLEWDPHGHTLEDTVFPCLA